MDASFFGKTHGRFAAMFTLIATMLLAACGGGGGGGGSDPAPTPTPTPTTVTVVCSNGTSSTAATTALANANCPLPKVVSISPVDKATGVAVGVVTVTVTTDSTLDATSINGTNFKVLAPGPTTVAGTVSPDGTKVFKWVSTAVLSPAQVYTTLWVGVKDALGRTMTGSSMFTMAVISCTLPQVPSSDGMTCVTPVLRYTDKVYAIWTGAYPYAVTKTGVMRVTNKTSVAGLAPFFNCWLASLPLSDGKVLTSCQESVSLARNVFYIDPTKDEINDYTGTVPTGIVWKDVEPVDPATPTWGAKAKVSDGWYFTTTDARWVLNFQADATGAITVVKAGTFAVDGTISLMVPYTN